MIDDRLKREEAIEAIRDRRDLLSSKYRQKEEELARIIDEYCLCRIGEAVAIYADAADWGLVPNELLVFAAPKYGDIVIRKNSLVRRWGYPEVCEEAYLPASGKHNREILASIFAALRKEVWR